MSNWGTFDSGKDCERFDFIHALKTFSPNIASISSSFSRFFGLFLNVSDFEDVFSFRTLVDGPLNAPECQGKQKRQMTMGIPILLGSKMISEPTISGRVSGSV